MQATKEDIEALEARFSQVISFSAGELQRTSSQWKSAIIGKFLDKRFPLEFIQKEMKFRWNIEGDLQVMSLSEDLLLFSLPPVEIQDRVLAKGPWSLASQLLAMEAWRPSFQPSRDQLSHRVPIPRSLEGGLNRFYELCFNSSGFNIYLIPQQGVSCSIFFYPLTAKIRVLIGREAWSGGI
ncbi:uncharacterized protein [Elaeis guineensis]|uniref:Uncharacterized protein LOC105032616 isoform X2 n=1 Tax=Elaeis guineensis var. tenera TaxID=51953 RepID=A0A6J0PAE2_ELAGV|nr:uncharacterized protein LOC105032616 isoform X2 [Elaeis guineensis]